MPIMINCQRGKRGQFIGVKSAHNDRIQLDGSEVRPFGSGNPFPNTIYLTAAGNVLEFLAVQRIEAYIYTVQSRIG